MPDKRFAKLFAGPSFCVEKTLRVEMTTLDTFFQTHPTLPRPDILKLDTQGTELAILEKATECLKSLCLVEVEVEFLPHYEGQSLFPEIARYLMDSGFDIVYLNRVYQQRKSWPGFSKGQLTFGDALFARREDRCGDVSEDRMIKFVVLLINYGLVDYAYDVLRSIPAEYMNRAELLGYCERVASHSRRSRLAARISPWIDKWALLLLHFRKHNGLAYDSDRSWPNR